MKTKNHLRYIFLSHLPLIVVYLLTYMIYAYLGVKLSKLLGAALDVAKSDMNQYVSFAETLVAVLGLMIVSFLICTAMRNFAKKKMYIKLRTDLYNAIVSKDLGIFHKKGVDVYTSELVNDVKMIETDYLGNKFLVIEDLIMLSIAMISIFFMNWQSALFIFLVSLLPVVIPMFLMAKLQEKMMGYAQMNQSFLQSVTDYMEGFETYKNFNSIELMKKTFDEENRKLAKTKKNTYLFMDLLMAILTSISNFIMCSILFLGMFFSLSGKMTVGDAFGLMFMSSCVISPISTLAQNLPSLLGVKSIEERYNSNFQDETVEKSLSFDKKISISQLNITMNDRDIIKNVSFELEKGKKYSFVGGSGSGKSTILKAILGYYPEYDGKVTYDGVNIEEANKDSVFNNVAYLSQNTQIFKGTFRDNLTMFSKDITDEQIRKAIKYAKLEKKLSELQAGLDTYIEEGGKNFSGGEKQRIAIARALLTGKQIFFLDEATSALDYLNFLAIEKMILKIPDVTLAVITHRIDKNIMSQYDVVYVIKQGELHAKGTYEELYNKNEYFKELVDSQKIEEEKVG